MRYQAQKIEFTKHWKIIEALYVEFRDLLDEIEMYKLKSQLTYTHSFDRLNLDQLRRIKSIIEEKV